MGVVSTGLAVASLASTAVGTVMKMKGDSQQAEAQRAAEEQRKRAMELDAQRKSIEQIRQNQRSRAMALTTATSQGAQYGSALPGAYGQFDAQTRFNLEGINKNLQFGEEIFSANRQASFGAQISGLGTGLQSLGSTGIQSLGAVNRLANSNWGFGFDPYTGDPRKIGWFG